MSNCIWRIHEYNRGFDKKNILNVLEFVDEDTNTYNCSKTEWFNDTITKIDRKDTYTCDGIRGIVKHPNYQENIQDIFDQCDKDPAWKEKKLFKFQDDYSNDDDDDDDSKLSFDEEQAITILIESYDDNLDKRCKSTDSLDSKYRALCYKRNSNEERKRFNNFIKTKTKTSKEITIEGVRNNTNELLRKLTNKKLFDIYLGIAGSDYTYGGKYNGKYDKTKQDLQDDLTKTLQKIKNKYINKPHILPEEIQIYLDDNDNVDINKGIEFNITDLQGSSLYPDQYSSLLTEIQKNRKFRNCIDEKLGIGKNDKIMKELKKKNFTIRKWKDKHITYIAKKIKNFESLTPSEIRQCLSKLSFSDKLQKDICNGDISLNMIEGFMIVLEFFNIHINKKDIIDSDGFKNIKILIRRTAPSVKNIFRRIIDISESIESDVCLDKTSNVTKALKKLYNNLFESSKCSRNQLFPSIKWKWFKPFNNIFGKVILLIFICFIFAKIVDLFSGKDCCPQAPVNK
tara:strand:- start:160 stop:1695 length:1536 start_codon:yes stop_codon:yes gene_type:complete